MKYVISVSKTYKHRGNHRHKSAKKHWFIYYYDKEYRLHCDLVNWVQAMYYKTKKMHRIHYDCPECGKKWFAIVKSKNEEIECPNCGGLIKTRV